MSWSWSTLGCRKQLFIKIKVAKNSIILYFNWSGIIIILRLRYVNRVGIWSVYISTSFCFHSHFDLAHSCFPMEVAFSLLSQHSLSSFPKTPSTRVASSYCFWYLAIHTDIVLLVWRCRVITFYLDTQFAWTYQLLQWRWIASEEYFKQILATLE